MPIAKRRLRLRYALAAAALISACGGGAQSGPEAVVLPPQSSSTSTDDSVTLAQTGEDERTAAVPIMRSDPVWGSRTALVTIVEFADFQCPFCSRAAATVAQLEKDYGPHALRVVFKHAPLPPNLHPEARPCAEAAETVRALAGNAAFWTFHDLAYHDQQNLGMASYEAWAKRSGVSVPAFRDAMRTHRFEAKVDDDAALAKELDASSTPTFFINGLRITGAQPADKFKAAIDTEIEAAKDKLTKGVAADDVYTRRAKDNYSTADDEDAPDTKTVWKLPLGTSPQLGPKTALVTIVEFSDFQCPYCKREQSVLQQIRTAYGADVRLVFKQMALPMHPRAEPAAELALEARAEKADAGFWAAHDKLFDAQPQLDDADLDRVAGELHLDLAKVHAAITTHKYQHTLDEDADLGDDVQAAGTPHFFIDGRRIVGAQPFDKFKVIIDEELAKARALVAQGTKPEDVYAELTKNGQSPPPPEQKTIVLQGSAPVKGPLGAQVTIVELADFQCPYCKKAAGTVNDVLAAYPNKVKLVWRHFPLPFHSQAELAAEASVEAFRQKGNDGFWKMHDALFAHQSDPDGLARAQIDGYARTIGLDMAKVRTSLDTGKNASSVDNDKQSADSAGLTGAPSFFIGTGNATGTWTAYYIAGAQPLAKFKKLVELALGTHP
jgi:protein-disulfide isomerase